MPVDVADTNTRLFPQPAEVTAEALGDLDAEAAALVKTAMSTEGPTLKVEDARPLEEFKPAYRGRHRTTDDVTTRPILLQQRAAAVGVPLPARAPGAALAAEATPAEVPAVAAKPGILAGILRALPRFPWGAR